MKVTPQHLADGSSWFTYLMACLGGVLLFFDNHATGLMAMAAILTAFVNWYYRARKPPWDGGERRNQVR